MTRRWVSVWIAKQLWHQFWKDSHRLSSQLWRRWAATLALGLGICALVTFGLTLMVKHQVEQGSLQAWDTQTLSHLAKALPLTFSRVITWESPGNLLGMVPVVIVFTGMMVGRSPHPPYFFVVNLRTLPSRISKAFSNELGN